MKKPKALSSIQEWISSPGNTQKIILLFVVWLALLLFFSFFVYAIGQAYKGEKASISLSGFFQSLVHYDAGWYIGIARLGYHNAAFYSDANQVYMSAAYFPLYPTLIRILSYPFFGNYEAAALAISWLALLFALFYLSKLTGIFDVGDNSFRSCLFLILFPTACFFLFPYSDSLCLLCAVASFYHARRSSWILAGIWGFFGCLLRPVGLAIFVAIALEALHQSEWRLSRMRPRMTAIFLVPMGLVAYFTYLQWRFGDFFYYLEAQDRGWSSGFRPWGLFSAIRHFVMPETFSEFARYGYLLFFLALFTFLMIFVFKRYGYPLGSYVLAYLVIFLLSSPANAPLESMNRHVLVLFPAFMLLASWGERQDFERFYIFAGTLGLAIFTTIYMLNFFSG